MKCPACGKRVPADARVCKHCGKRMPQPKRFKEETKPKVPRLSQRQILIAGLMFILLGLVALVLIVLPRGEQGRQALGPKGYDAQITIERKRCGSETASNAVYGEVIASYIRATRQGTITVRSLHTGAVYTFSVGWHTSYRPRRRPAIGERVKVYYHYDENLMKATQVIIDQ